MPTFTTLITTAELTDVENNCLVFDCRAALGDVNWGRTAYLQGHIAGAYHLDLDKDLADPPGERGRHPLPDIQRFRSRVGELGLQPGQQVVVYDDAGGAFAARAWWMFRWLGHAHVAVLDGGLQHWTQALTTALPPQPSPTRYPVLAPLTRLIATETLQKELGRLAPNQLIDARSQARWAGREEPIDPVAGHIPQALCLPFQENLNDHGGFKSASALAARFAGVSDNAICYCGSGVTAAHNVLAMRIAGLAEPVLYADSWSGWITDPARPVETRS
ncbi:MAG: sulfurtransferase [bacterium]